MKKTFLLIGILIFAVLLLFLFNLKPLKTGRLGIVSPTPLTIQTITPSGAVNQNPLQVTSSLPANQAKNIAVSQRITLTFNRAFSLNEVSFSSYPSFPFSSSANNNILVITPKVPLLANTLYTYFINYNSPNSQGETRTFSTIGNNPQSVDEYGNKTGQATNQNQVEDPGFILQGHTPYTGNTFSVTSENFNQQATFTVTLKGTDKNQDKQDFINWAKSFGITDAQVPSLNVTYQ